MRGAGGRGPGEGSRPTAVSAGGPALRSRLAPSEPEGASGAAWERPRRPRGGVRPGRGRRPRAVVGGDRRGLGSRSETPSPGDRAVRAARFRKFVGVGAPLRLPEAVLGEPLCPRPRRAPGALVRAAVRALSRLRGRRRAPAARGSCWSPAPCARPRVGTGRTDARPLTGTRGSRAPALRRAGQREQVATAAFARPMTGRRRALGVAESEAGTAPLCGGVGGGLRVWLPRRSFPAAPVGAARVPGPTASGLRVRVCVAGGTRPPSRGFRERQSGLPLAGPGRAGGPLRPGRGVGLERACSRDVL